MKTTLLAAALLLGAALPLAVADDGLVTVHLGVGAGKVGTPGWRACEVSVPAGADAGAVLDQAVVDGCILAWTHSEFEGFGRYVASIDHVQEAVLTFWAFSVNGVSSDYGIDAYEAAEGDAVGFTYTQWLTML